MRVIRETFNLVDGELKRYIFVEKEGDASMNGEYQNNNEEVIEERKASKQKRVSQFFPLNIKKAICLQDHPRKSI